MAEGLTTAELPGRKKAAILCVSLGPAGAASVFKHLSDEQIEQLTFEMARTATVDVEQAEFVLREAVELAQARLYVSEGGVKYARDVLERAVGQPRANEILGRLAIMLESTPFDFLRGTPPEQICAFLRGEHPQTIALVLANLPAKDLAAKVMQLLPPEQQASVATRIARMDGTSPDVVKEVARVMKEKLETVLQSEHEAAGGVESLADILNSADRGTERHILDHLAGEDEELAEQVRALMFVFEDVLKLEDRAIQLVLKEVETKDLALALRGASDEVRERLLANMSQRGAEMLQEEMEYMPPQRRKAVEEAQSKIVAVVRRLEEAGEIVVARGGGDDEIL